MTAVAADGSATVSWLAPSKDGGSPISRFDVTSRPAGRSCVSVVRAPGEHSCAVGRLANGVDYRFVVRAVNRAGAGAFSGPSSPVRPLGISALRLVALAHVLRYGERVIYRAYAAPRGTTGGAVLFAEDGRVLPGCQSARVVHGRASCEVRLTSASRHLVLATYSGDRILSGTQRALAVLVTKAPSSFRTAAVPSAAQLGVAVDLRAWHLPDEATGKVVFSAGPLGSVSPACVPGEGPAASSSTSTRRPRSGGEVHRRPRLPRVARAHIARGRAGSRTFLGEGRHRSVVPSVSQHTAVVRLRVHRTP